MSELENGFSSSLKEHVGNRGNRLGLVFGLEITGPVILAEKSSLKWVTTRFFDHGRISTPAIFTVP